MVIPQVEEDPALTWRQTRPPETALGLGRLVVVPSPSWPLSLRPQQSGTAIIDRERAGVLTARRDRSEF